MCVRGGLDRPVCCSRTAMPAQRSCMPYIVGCRFTLHQAYIYIALICVSAQFLHILFLLVVRLSGERAGNRRQAYFTSEQ